MGILDRYLLGLFLKTAAICLLTVFGLYVVFDIFINDELIDLARKSPQGAASFLATYYQPRVLAFFEVVGGLAGMAAAMVALTLTARSQELTAIVAAGIPPRRFALPMLFGAVAMVALSAVNRELGIPPRRDQLRLSAQDLRADQTRPAQPRWDNRTQLLFKAQLLRPFDRRVLGMTVKLPAELQAWGPAVVAAEAVWMDVDRVGGRPAGFLLRGVRQPADLSVVQSADVNGLPTLFSPADTTWLKPDEVFVATQTTFDQLGGSARWGQYLSTWELVGGLRSGTLDYTGEMLTIVHGRFVKPLAELALILLGTAIALRGRDSNVFVVAGWALILVAGYLALTLACNAAGGSGLASPVLAAWGPLLILGPVTAAQMRPLWD